LDSTQGPNHNTHITDTNFVTTTNTCTYFPGLVWCRTHRRIGGHIWPHPTAYARKRGPYAVSVSPCTTASGPSRYHGWFDVDISICFKQPMVPNGNGWTTHGRLPRGRFGIAVCSLDDLPAGCPFPLPVEFEPERTNERVPVVWLWHRPDLSWKQLGIECG
jgi:hypothetical protein